MPKEYILLIDGDNVNCSYLDSFSKYIEENYGHIIEIHLVGKLKSSYLNDWKQAVKNISNLVTYNIEENHKNSTDIQMALIAFRKYFSENKRRFIILSSDSDMISVSTGLPADAEIIIGYSEQKASPRYLAELDRHSITRLNIDAIRGELSEEELREIVTETMKAYINFKLSDKFFNYNTVQEWVMDRYPDIDVTVDTVYKYCEDLILHFTPDGVTLKLSRKEYQHQQERQN